MLGKLAPRDDDERDRAIDAGHDLDRVLTTDDLVSSDDAFFAATGITDGESAAGCALPVRRRHDPHARHAGAGRARSATFTASTRCGRYPATRSCPTDADRDPRHSLAPLTSCDAQLRRRPDRQRDRRTVTTFTAPPSVSVRTSDDGGHRLGLRGRHGPGPRRSCTPRNDWPTSSTATPAGTISRIWPATAVAWMVIRWLLQHGLAQVEHDVAEEGGDREHLGHDPAARRAAPWRRRPRPSAADKA